MSEATPLKKEALEYLLKYHLEWAREPLVVIEHISGEAVIELIGDNAIEEATKYPTLTKYVCVCVGGELPLPPCAGPATPGTIVS